MKAAVPIVPTMIAAAVLLASSQGCGDSVQVPSRPSPVQSAALSPAPPSPTPPAPGSPVWTNGTFTWASITASRTICPEITSQIGQSWRPSLGVEQNGSSVTLLLAEGAPPDPNDPLAEPPEKFVGTRTGDTIAASLQGPLGAMGCPTDSAPTPEVGGELTATVTGDQISGVYTDVYGSGASQVSFTFRFQAGFPKTPSE